MNTRKRPRAALTGAALGAVAWAAYALVEGLLTYAWLLIGDGTRFPAPIHARMGIVLTGGLAVAGMALGAVLGVVWGKQDRLRPAVTATLAAATVAHLAYQEQFRYGNTHFLVALSVVLALLMRVARPGGRPALRALESPWVASLLLILPYWASRSGVHADLATAFVAACVGGILAATVAAASRGRATAIDAALLAVAALVVVAVIRVRGGGTAVEAPAAAAGPSARPNVVLIVWDTVRADHLSLYGYPRETTPYLRRLARDAAVYRRASSTSSWTLGSHASMFTGLFVDHHGSHPTPEHSDGRPLADRLPTLAGALGAVGYRTGAVIANHGYLHSFFGLARGFEIYDIRTPHPLLPAWPSPHLSWAVKKLFDPLLPVRESEVVYRRAREIRERAAEIVASWRREGAPFFLFVNLMDAHDPVLPPAPYDSLFPGRVAGLHEGEVRDFRARFNGGRGFDFEALRDHVVSQYDGSLAYLDAETGAFIEDLKTAGLYDNTLIIVTSDHGEALGDRGLWGHPVSAYEDQLHVPLVIKFPKSQGAGVFDEAVSLVDLMPTALAVAGIGTPPPADGRNLLEPPPGDRLLWGDHIVPGWVHGRWGFRVARAHHAVYAGRRKYLASSLGRKELYDLGADPGESKDLFHPEDPRDARFGSSLEARIKGFPPAVGRGQLSKAVLERLRSLGYVQ